MSESTARKRGPCLAAHHNQSDPFQIGNKYGGIPVNLVTNCIGLGVLLILFFLIRKSTIRKVSKKVAKSTLDGVDAVTTKWTQALFGGDTNQAQAAVNRGPKDDGDAGALPTTYGSTEEQKERRRWGSTGSLSGNRNQSLLSGAKFLIAKEKSLTPLMGEDAVQYLRFQKYITIYVFITTIISCGVVLPVNYQGTLQGNATDFGHTTMANVDPLNKKEKNYLWIHIILSFLLFPLAIFLMRRFSIGLRMQDASLGVTRTVAIENIPHKLCTVENLQAHFQEVYPVFHVKDIQLAYDVAKLTSLCQRLRDVKESKRYTIEHNRRYKTELQMYPISGARCCSCCCMPCHEKVSCLEYYDEEERRLKNKIEICRNASLKTKLGMAFVTFASINHARQVYREHKYSLLNFRHNPPVSAVDLKPKDWKVWYAPPPSDIIWENLSDKRELLLLKKVCAGLFMFVICFFLTTPQIIVSQLDPIINILKNLTEPDNDDGNSTSSHDGNDPGEILSSLPSLITNFLPTLMLWSFTALLPVVVAYSDRLLGHWTRSGENHAVMKKTFWYLIFMVIILPTFGLTSGQATIDFVFRNFKGDDEDNDKETDKERWDCIFLPDSGAFFVNYVITAAMIGSGLELIRFPDMFMYLVQICKSRSKSDTPAVRRAITYRFKFGEHYARMMMVFAMVVMYSIICPLITPFGCLYFVLQHLVDRHNLAYVYAPSKINKKIHATAIHFVIMSVALMQVLMVVFSFVRSGDLSSGNISTQTKIAVLLFVLTLNIASANIWSSTCKSISPIKYEDILIAEEDDEDDLNPYIPDVLKGFSHGYVDGYSINGSLREEGRIIREEKPKKQDEESDEAQNVQNGKSGTIHLENIIVEEEPQLEDDENEESTAMIDECDKNSTTKDKE